MINLQRALQVRQPLDERGAEGGRVAAKNRASPATARPEAPHPHAQLPMHGWEETKTKQTNQIQVVLASLIHTHLFV